MNAYRHRIWREFEAILSPLGCKRILDFGCGDGWFASQVTRAGLCGDLQAIDVVRRKVVHHEPTLYPGGALPFPDLAFDLAYAVDVLHHCDDPVSKLDELARVSSRYILIKDHVYHSIAGKWALAILDELGNRRFSIPSPHHYQYAWSWDKHLLASGWRRARLTHPMRCHDGLLGALTNGLQYTALYERRG